MRKLCAGFSRVNITPALGTEIVGYFHARYASGVLDELEINALALAVGEDKLVLMSADLCYINKPAQEKICEAVRKATGLTKDQIVIHSTHTHTGPVVSMGAGGSLVKTDEES